MNWLVGGHFGRIHLIIYTISALILTSEMPGENPQVPQTLDYLNYIISHVLAQYIRCKSQHDKSEDLYEVFLLQYI